LQERDHESNGAEYAHLPAILTEVGLCPAVAAAADSAAIPVELDDEVEDRYTEVVETAAYLMVDGVIEDAAARRGRPWPKSPTGWGRLVAS
jgi:hypothetical protein